MQRKAWYFYKQFSHYGRKHFTMLWFGKMPDRCSIHERLKHDLSRFDADFVSFGYQDSAEGLTMSLEVYEADRVQAMSKKNSLAKAS